MMSTEIEQNFLFRTDFDATKNGGTAIAVEFAFVELDEIFRKLIVGERFGEQNGFNRRFDSSKYSAGRR